MEFPFRIYLKLETLLEFKSKSTVLLAIIDLEKWILFKYHLKEVDK